MFKKIRCIYWEQRDKGKGRQCLFLFALLAMLIVLFFVNLIRFGIPKGGEPPAVVSGSAASSYSVSGAAVSGGTIGVSDTPKIQKTDQPEEESRYELDTTGISSLLSFMTDEAFEKLVTDLKKECKKRKAASIRTLDYQKTTNTYQVTTYLIDSDNFVFKVSYHLKSNAVSVIKTELSQNDVEAMKKADEKKAAEKLKKERQEKKKNLEKAKKNAKKKKKTKKDVG